MLKRRNNNVVLCILREISHKADPGLRLRRVEEVREDKSQRQPALTRGRNWCSVKQIWSRKTGDDKGLSGIH